MKKTSRLQNLFMLSDKAYKDLKKAILACTLTNFSMMLPFSVSIMLIVELIKPLQGKALDWTNIWILYGFGILSAIIVFICTKNDYKKTYVTSYMASEETRTTLAEKIRKLPMSVFNSKDLSEMTTHMMGDVSTAEHALSHVIPQLIANAISITVICLCMAVFDWRMSIAVFISVPIAFMIIFLGRMIYGKLSKKHAAAHLAASGQVQEYIEGIKVIRSCNMNGEKFNALEDALRKMMQWAVKMEFGTGVFVTGAQVILQSGVGITVFLGALLLTKGQIDFISLVMFLLIVVRIYGPFLTELTLLPELFYHQIAIKRMRALMDIEIQNGDDEIEIDDFNIEFKDVNFSYNKNNENAISNMNITIPANSITALVGPSGSGKSTISRLIARFWDVNSGRIEIGGTDIKSIEPEHLMSYMSFVFQDVVLFNDTVFNNIKIGNMSATDEEVYAAAKAACCDEFVIKMKDGYNTILGENGATISGGERQRISIARALLKNAPIVLLDEATASLDPENEASIQQAISRLVKNKTVIVIAHRLRTISDADKIIVLNNGKAEEQGTHNELMNKNGLYHKLFTIQQESLGWSV
ncbi:MAG: ABC transporter ATP-binding protein [Clostridiales bacterium]|nr:ABC transporter ATP-binding protein [Clostridiales bacterium]